MNIDLTLLAIRVLPLLFAITVHEFAHAYVAVQCGDPTPKDQGRLTLNPIAHLDLLGTLCLLFAPIGWGRPVQTNPYNYRHLRRDQILVSVAGVTMNLVTAVAAALVLRALLAAGVSPAGSATGTKLWLMGEILIMLSVGLAVFNLLPFPPLDGSKVVMNLLPPPMAAAYRRIAPFASIVILMLIFFTGVVGRVLWPVVEFALRALLGDALIVLPRVFGWGG
jgi:Zn-dependent protease